MVEYKYLAVCAHSMKAKEVHVDRIARCQQTRTSKSVRYFYLD